MYLSSIIFSGPAGQARRERVGGQAAAAGGLGEGASAGNNTNRRSELLLGGSNLDNKRSASQSGLDQSGASAAATSTPMAKKFGNDICSNVEMHVDRCLTKFQTYAESYDYSTTNLVNHLLTLQQELLADAEPGSDMSQAAVMVWEKAVKKIRDQLERMGGEHREMHGGVSKCGREIDRNFEHNFAGLCPKEAHQYETDASSRALVNKLVAQHLLSNGQLDVADCFEQEAGINLADANKAVFVEMQSILDSLKRRDLDPALEWAKANRERLLGLNSNLEFSLRKLKFIELLKSGVQGQKAAVEYARNFEPFSEKHAAEIQALMGCLLFLPSGLETSPYSHLLDPALWSQIADMFTRDSRALLGMSVNSPLSVLLNSGTRAVPALLNIREVMQQRNVIGMWGHNDELPIEIDLGPDSRFHSIFSCPILRQQTSDHNPPMRLNCGHVISKEALQKLASNSKLKCPYCPVESTLNEAKQIYF